MSEKKVSLAQYTGKALAECSSLELFNGLVQLVQEQARQTGYNEGKKKIYYISAEFLIGKLLSNNLINLGLYEQVKAELEAAGKSLAELEEFENEPSLGNGGLGRLAACFLDSLATLGLPADGIGLAYHYGLFKQVFADNRQSETPDGWLRWGQESWLRRTDKRYHISFGDFDVESVLYEITVTGYNGASGRLRLFDIDSIDERLVGSGIHFDKSRIKENLTLFLYPDDSDEAGRLLRVYQQYFMVSNAAQLILEECIARGSNLHDLDSYAAIQINDTHPSMVIPELIRLLTERGIDFDEAVSIVTRVCAYTNHTILAEALEKWPASYLEKAAPQLMPIIRRLDVRVKEKYADPFVHIIDGEDRVHMANMDIHYTHSINGVAALHTEILKNSELNAFYRIYPEKFNNKTNGITFRRWLIQCDPALAALISSRIGEGWKKDADELEKLLDHADDAAFLQELLAVKAENKKVFADWLANHQGTVLDTDAVFDVQSKRLHEYKRQQLNLLWIIRRYLDIKTDLAAGRDPGRSVTVIFGAKAAPAYTIAKDIIHAILTLSELLAREEAGKYLRVAMIENYNITAAEKLIPAADISEQISLASKEASGTGNMKFMLNGAVTLGTMDGANVEIAELVGEENIYTFGASSDEVIERYASGSYNARETYEAVPRLKEAVDFLVSERMKGLGDGGQLERLYNELVNKDWFMTFPDFEDYIQAKEKMLADMADEKAWARRMLVNIAKAGYFSSDRTIRQYEDEIWHLR